VFQPFLTIIAFLGVFVPWWFNFGGSFAENALLACNIFDAYNTYQVVFKYFP
jgi:hypothetical protein